MKLLAYSSLIIQIAYFQIFQPLSPQTTVKTKEKIQIETWAECEIAFIYGHASFSPLLSVSLCMQVLANIAGDRPVK